MPIQGYVILALAAIALIVWWAWPKSKPEPEPDRPLACDKCGRIVDQCSCVSALDPSTPGYGERVDYPPMPKAFPPPPKPPPAPKAHRETPSEKQEREHPHGADGRFRERDSES